MVFGKHLSKQVIYRTFILSLLLLGLSHPVLARGGDSDPLKEGSSPPVIEAVSIRDNGSALLIGGNRPFMANTAVTAIRLPNPYRLIVDIPNTALGASLAKPRRINRHGISEIEFSQTRSMFYNAVRMTVYVDNYEVLNKLQPILQDKTLVLALEPPAGPAPLPDAILSEKSLAGKPSENRVANKNSIHSFQAPLPGSAGAPASDFENFLSTLPADCTIIKNAFWRDNQLVLQADPNHSPQGIQIKNRFRLKEPDRLVLDIENAAVGSKDLLTPLTIDNKDIRQVRIGQFDDRTVRVVIEAPSPEYLSTFYPGTDKRLLTISQGSSRDIASLPADTPLGQLDNVSVAKRGASTVIRVSTSVSMVPQVTKDGQNVVLELFNIAAHPGNVSYDRPAYPNVMNLRLENLNATQPNSKMIVNLLDDAYDVTSQISTDKRMLELIISPPAPLSRTGAKAPFPARVVVDAGHGGKDMGANRDGVLEKELNLQVALKLKRALEARGIKVYMTRSQDIFLPLPEISAITNYVHPDLFVSVHTNASNNPEIHGIETYYYTSQSIPLARRVHHSLVNTINAPDRGVRQARYYVIHHTSVPAILCEMGYISNTEEREELQSESRQQNTANGIADGVVDFLRASVSANAKR